MLVSIKDNIGITLTLKGQRDIKDIRRFLRYGIKVIDQQTDMNLNI